MSKEISLSTGTDPKNSLLLPNLDAILKFSKGDFNIAQELHRTVIYRHLAAGNYEREVVELFLDKSGMKTLKALDTYKSNLEFGNEFIIPRSDIVPKIEHVGQEPLEIATLQTVFETQKPYLDISVLFSESMVDFEDIIARHSTLLELSGRSLKPKFNPNSLFTKRKLAEDDITKIKNLAIDKRGGSKFSKLTTKEKIDGINMEILNLNSTDTKKFVLKNDAGDEFKWEILNIEYSTGPKLEGIDYKNIYRDLLDNGIFTDTDNGIIQPSKYGKPIVDKEEKPPVIVFSIYDSFGKIDDINSNKWNWLYDIYTTGIEGPQKTKWYGEWKQLNPNSKGDYEDYIKRYIENRLRIKNNGITVDENTINEVTSLVLNKFNVQDIINNGNDNSFLNLINEIDPKKGFDLGDGNSADINLIAASRKEMFLPKEIEYKGKKVFIDPESDYYLQIVKLVPTKKVSFNGNGDISNNKLRKTTPLVGNYQGNNVEDVLLPENYTTSFLSDSHVIKKNGEKNRIISIDKYLLNRINTRDIKKFDLNPTYVIEGILKDEEIEEKQIINDTSEKRFYNRGHYYSSISEFINSTIDVAVDLLPQLIKTRNLFAKPHEFMFDKILEKVGDNFEFFSDELIEKFAQANAMSNIEERVTFVSEDLVLKKFVFIDEATGKMKLSMDSVSVFNLLGFNFGFQFTEMNPKFISKKNGRDVTDQSSLKRSINGNFKDNEIGDIRSKQTGNINGNSNLNNIEREKLRNEIKNSAGDKSFETVSIDYSTDTLGKDIDYEKIYISQEVKKLIAKGDELFKIAATSDVTQDLDAAIEAIQSYNEALVADPNNRAIQEKIKELEDKFKIQLNIIFQFLMDFTSFPIKVVHNMVVEMIDLFERVTFEKVEDEITTFLKFEWISENFLEDNILDFLGIRFNPSILTEWVNKLNRNELSDFDEFDLDLVMAMPFISRMPTVTGAELKVIGLKPLYAMNQLFQFIEQMVNEMIKYIFDVLNIDKALSVPELKISNKVGNELTIEVLKGLI